jgi:hypothetical protein
MRRQRRLCERYLDVLPVDDDVGPGHLRGVERFLVAVSEVVTAAVGRGPHCKRITALSVSGHHAARWLQAAS